MTSFLRTDLYRGPLVHVASVQAPSPFGPNCPPGVESGCGPWSTMTRQQAGNTYMQDGVEVVPVSIASMAWLYSKPNAPGGMPQSVAQMVFQGPGHAEAAASALYWAWAGNWVDSTGVYYVVGLFAPDWNWLQPYYGRWTWGPTVATFFKAPTNQ